MPSLNKRVQIWLAKSSVMFLFVLSAVVSTCKSQNEQPKGTNAGTAKLAFPTRCVNASKQGFGNYQLWCQPTLTVPLHSPETSGKFEEVVNYSM